MSPHRYSRESQKSSMETNAFTSLSIPSWLSVGSLDEVGGSFGSTSVSSAQFVGQCYPSEDSDGIPGPNMSHYPCIYRYGSDREAESLMSFHKDVDCFNSNYVEDIALSCCNRRRCQSSIKKDHVQFTNFFDESQFKTDDFSLPQIPIKTNELSWWDDDPLIHSYLCRIDQCTTMCKQIKRLFVHVRSCGKRGTGQQCASCSWIGFLFQMHVQVCKAQNCPLPFCNIFQEERKQQCTNNVAWW